MSFAQAVPRGRGARPGRHPPEIGGAAAWVRVRGASVANLSEARAGERLRLVFRHEESASSSEQVVIASLGETVLLASLEDVAVGRDEEPGACAVQRGRVLVCSEGGSEAGGNAAGESGG